MNDAEVAQRRPLQVGTHSTVRPRLANYTVPRSTFVAPRATSMTTPHGIARAFRARLRTTDVLVVGVAVSVAMVAARATGGSNGVVAQWWADASTGLVIVGLWVAALRAYRSRDARVLGLGVAEYKRVVGATTTTFGLLAIAFVLTPVSSARWYFVVALPVGLCALLVSRWLWRRWLVRLSAKGHSLSRVIVVGSATEVTYVEHQIRDKSRAAYSVVGSVINVDSPVNVAEEAHRRAADAVIVAGTPHDHPTFVHDLAWSLEGTATELILATNLANVAGPRIHLRPVEGLPLIHVEIPQFEGGKHALKRVFDFSVSAIALVVLAPFFAALALIIKADSPGPAFFSQERVGRDGRLFTIYKFRSMSITAEAELHELMANNEGAGALFKLRADPRVTRVGRFIRKHSLDEFPQLLNVLRGEMSIVGPRPPLPREVREYESHVHRRLYIRPGLTGMWQVNGRSSLDWEESVKLDLYYVENWSLVGDIVIIWRTLREIRSPLGAF